MSANGAWALSNYRLGLVQALIDAGYELHAAVPRGVGEKALTGIGVQLHDLPMEARGTSPIADGKLFLRYCRLFARLKPFAYLGFTIKPNVYGALAARLFDVRILNNVTGLGTLFVTKSAVTKIAEQLYRWALRPAHAVFFQNDDDAALFVSKGIVRPGQVRRIPGSGIDLERFAPRAKAAQGEVTFLLTGRLLWEKGVGEFVEAAAAVRQKHPSARFQILGFIEPPGPASVGQSDIDDWVRRGLIEYLGSSDDVRTALSGADCVVLPSYYREGVPRALLEAAAMGLPVITTDMPGCRDAVADGRSGFLCAPRSVEGLVEVMSRFLALDPARRRKLGEEGRAKMQQEFNQDIVHRAYLQALSE